MGFEPLRKKAKNIIHRLHEPMWRRMLVLFPRPQVGMNVLVIPKKHPKKDLSLTMAHSYTGWWLGHPSEKYEFVNWDD